jgi:lysophospholipase L1-like esterase
MLNDLIPPHSVILFQGDSITDTGRDRSHVGPYTGTGLGSGYPRLIADRLLEIYPDHHLQIYNRGISGDRIQDLESRWEQDTLRLLPDLVSILIGINDTWNYLFVGIGASPDGYLRIYTSILERTLERLPGVKLVLCEPFALMTDMVTADWTEDLSQRQTVVQRLARDFQALFVPFQAAVDQAAKDTAPHLLLDDGVHPTEKGHQVLADCWLKYVLGENRDQIPR